MICLIFDRRNFALEFSGNVFDYISEISSDYFIFDMACCRFDLYRNKKANLGGAIRTKYVRLFYEEALNKFCKQYNLFPFSEVVSDEIELKNIMDHCLPSFFEKIRMLYPNNKIIFVETIPADFCLCKTGRIRECTSWGKREGNEWIDLAKDRINYGNTLANKMLKDVHMIEFPDYILSDAEHKWGPDRLHYVFEYYDYVYDALKIIAQNFPIEKEKEILNILKKECSRKCYEKYCLNFRNTLKAKEELATVNLKLGKYIDYFKNILFDTEKLAIALTNIRSNGFKSCAFYGLSQLSIFYIEYFTKEGIVIDYIIENGKEEYYNNIKVVPRSNIEYPKTDVIIIGDIMNISSIAKKLRKVCEIPFSDVFKLVDKDFSFEKNSYYIAEETI